jgi:putative glutamine amidotransferase
MSTRIAIPEPTSADAAYNARSLPPYIAALQSAGATAVVIPLHERPERVAKLLAGVHGVLLPGSGFDVNPEKFGERPIPACNPADPAREAVDELLLQDAFNLHKPILAICYGIQSLNVWLNGSLIQDLPSQDLPNQDLPSQDLPSEGKTTVNHAPGRTILDAHPIRIAPGSLLARLSAIAGTIGEEKVNSSHHQALRTPGGRLRVTAISPADEVIEAVELDSPEASPESGSASETTRDLAHFVLGVQWHPERSYTASPLSRAIFAAFFHAAEAWKPRAIHESIHELGHESGVTA